MDFRQRPYSFFLSLIVFLVTTAGFCYQTWYISEDYFKYPTTTLVSLETFLPITIGPQIGLRISNRLQLGRPVRETFQSVQENINVTGFARTKTYGVNTAERKVRKNIFQMMDHFYIALSPIIPIEYTPDLMYTKRRTIYNYDITSNLLSSNNSLNVFIHPYHADWEGLHMTDYKVNCHALPRCHITITYTTKITKLTTPPYDTDCQDYRNIGYSSKEACFAQCLAQFLERHGFVLASNVLRKDILENSSLVVLPWYMKSLWMEDMSLISVDNDTDFTEMMGKINQILPSYQNHWKSCKAKCRRPDCITESTFPFVPSIVREDGQGLTTVILAMLPPMDQITIVSSQPKNQLVDWIIYILSCVNFWYGFTPFSLLEIVARHTKRNRKK